MKSVVILFSVLFSSFSFAAAAMPAHKDNKKAAVKIADKKAPEAPCAESAEEVMKKLEDKKKADAKKGLGLSLQGSATEGCKIK